MHALLPRPILRLMLMAALLLSGMAAAQAGASGPVLAAKPAGKLARQPIHVHYDPPRNPAHADLHSALVRAQVLEQARKFFVAFRLPRPLTLRTGGCDGDSNAWYDEGEILLCYEYLADIFTNARRADRPDWVSERDAMGGPVLDVILHEGAHALFDLFDVPIFGREEDAADALGSYAMLRLFEPQSPGLLAGVVYSYLVDTGTKDLKRLKPVATATVSRHLLADAHSTPVQRIYNLVCLAHGSDEARHGEAAQRVDLPQTRAEGCAAEFAQVQYAYRRLIEPHLDRAALLRLFPHLKTPVGKPAAR